MIYFLSLKTITMNAKFYFYSLLLSLTLSSAGRVLVF